jgi:hypothetical protein
MCFRTDNYKNVSFLNEVPNEVMVNYNPAYLESVLYNILLTQSVTVTQTGTPLLPLNGWVKMMKVLHFRQRSWIDLVKNADKIFGMYNIQ